ncbi:DUF397 domain-containing protein [Streptomyces sp. cg28]|uniref:DUF397 domain-containing protein n=1 Tax=Streptomyces sp. cg28 TaxID=3403457 RepID=UPI003B20F716
MVQQLVWIKSSRSSENSQNCVECAVLADSGLLVRDSKEGMRGSRLMFPEAVWGSFVGAIKSGHIGDASS